MPSLKPKSFPPPLFGQSGWMWSNKTFQIMEGTQNSQRYPKISIVTPSLNQGRFLETTIRSVLLQSYPNLEYIIIDGGSNDNSMSIIRKYSPWLKYWVSETDRGQAHALNKGFDQASGDIHAYINSDDYFEPGALSACASAYNKGHHWIVGRVRCWQEGIGYWPFPQLPSKTFAKWFLSCPIPQAGCFWSAELHHEMGQFREDLNYIIDYEFWLRFRFIKKIKPFLIDQPIAVYRIHSQSKTVAEGSEFAHESNIIREQYKYRLTCIQRGWLWVARWNRRARIHGKKAVMFIKKGEFRAAKRHIMMAFVAWPLLIMDLQGVFLAFKELMSREQNEPAIPEIWPEWDD
jgi:glycosyltransferase involved in cell wall biosynthesis